MKFLNECSANYNLCATRTRKSTSNIWKCTSCSIARARKILFLNAKKKTTTTTTRLLNLLLAVYCWIVLNIKSRKKNCLFMLPCSVLFRSCVILKQFHMTFINSVRTLLEPMNAWRAVCWHNSNTDSYNISPAIFEFPITNNSNWMKQTQFWQLRNATFFQQEIDSERIKTVSSPSFGIKQKIKK